jgi:hypothetical protein
MEAQQINGAIKDLAEAILGGDTIDDALFDTAEEFGLNPVLLRRKFREQHGVEPEGFARRQAEVAARVEANRAAQMDAAQHTAREHARCYTGTDPLLGRVFELDGEQFVYVNTSHRGRTHASKVGIVAIRVSDLSPRRLGLGWADRINRQIEK